MTKVEKTHFRSWGVVISKVFDIDIVDLLISFQLKQIFPIPMRWDFTSSTINHKIQSDAVSGEFFGECTIHRRLLVGWLIVVGQVSFVKISQLSSEFVSHWGEMFDEILRVVEIFAEDQQILNLHQSKDQFGFFIHEHNLEDKKMLYYM